MAGAIGKPKREARALILGFLLTVSDPPAEANELLHDRLGIGASFELQAEFDGQWKAPSRDAGK